MKAPTLKNLVTPQFETQQEYQIEQVGTEGFSEVETLFNANYPWKPVAPGFAHWRYSSSEIRGICLGVRQSSKGALVAAYGLEFLPAIDHGDDLLVGLVSDVVVDPEYHRIGLGSWLEEAVFEHALNMKCAFLICFPNPKLTALHSKSDEWITETNTRAFIRSASALSYSHDIPKVETSMTLPTGVDILWRTLQEQGFMNQGFVRNDKFLHWRFVEHPRNRYEFLSYKRQNRIQGFAVIKVWQDPFSSNRVGDIVDLLAENEDTNVMMLVAACRRLDLFDVSHYTLWSPPAVSDETLLRLGFQRDGFRMRPVQVRYACRKKKSSLDAWFLTQADTDIY